MLGKNPQNSQNYQWTNHVVFKMRQYSLSEQKIKSVIRNPFRREEGIVKNTIAVMQPVGSQALIKEKKWKQEIWVMYKTTKKDKKTINKGENNSLILNAQRKIISAWRYPGVSPKQNPIPEDIIREIEEKAEM